MTKGLAWLAAAGALCAQDSRFAVQSRLVLVPVTVTDAKSRIVEGLEAGEFVLFDNGRRQKTTLDVAGAGMAPIALVVAIQTSGISKAALEKVNSIGAMIRPVVTGARGCAAVVSFAERVTWMTDCTNDEHRLTEAFALVRPGTGKKARMLDAVHESVELLGKRPNSRRVLLLISESRDRGSEGALDQVAMAAQTAGVAVYAITYSAFRTAVTTRSAVTGEAPTQRPKRPNDEYGTVSGGPPHCGMICVEPPLPPAEQRVDVLGGMEELLRLGKTNTTQALAAGTGGTTLSFTGLKGLEEAIQKVGADLHSQYLLSFTPDDSTAGYHRLEVRVASIEVRVRARPGYWVTEAAAQ
jgi:VWFA-related protein